MNFFYLIYLEQKNHYNDVNNNNKNGFVKLCYSNKININWNYDRIC